MAKVLGIGGVFFKAADPKAVTDWYARVLGFDVSQWGSVMFTPPANGPTQQWSVHDAGTDYYDPSTQPFMVNFLVDDMDGVLAQARAAGVEPLRQEDGEYGRFAWLLDPAGAKIELWQAP
jgi:catechol 2,3-dioxygenase-like lactoylglutathione lyase family enzyme